MILCFKGNFYCYCGCQFHWMDCNSFSSLWKEGSVTLPFFLLFSNVNSFLLWKNELQLTQVESCLPGHWSDLLWQECVAQLQITYQHWLTYFQLYKLLWNICWERTWIKIIMEILLQSGRSKITENATAKSYPTLLFR